jgi:hypothetical protein
MSEKDKQRGGLSSTCVSNLARLGLVPTFTIPLNSRPDLPPADTEIVARPAGQPTPNGSKQLPAPWDGIAGVYNERLIRFVPLSRTYSPF